MPTDEEIASELRERLAILLLSIPGWKDNYTATRDSADWMIREANKVGWEISVRETPE